MPNFNNFLQLDTSDFEQPDFKRITISTKRVPPQSAGRSGAHVANLSNVTSSPLILVNSQSAEGISIRQASGNEGADIKIWQIRLHKHPHTDSGSNVDQLPDIKEHDLVTVGGVDYSVRLASKTHPHAFGETLLVYLTQDV